jgi:hypothetical protein
MVSASSSFADLRLGGSGLDSTAISPPIQRLVAIGLMIARQAALTTVSGRTARSCW